MKIKEKELSNQKEISKSKRPDLFEWNSKIDEKYGLVLNEDKRQLKDETLSFSDKIKKIESKYD